MYVSAAMVPLDALRDAQAAYWSDFYLSDDDIDRGWFTWERRISEQVTRPGTRVLLVGCGSGRDLLELARRGCEVTGIDMADVPLRRAREKLQESGLQARLIHAFIEDWPLDERYDVVWFSWLSYSYIPMSARRVALLSRLSAHVSPGGVVVLNVLRHPPKNVAIPFATWLGALGGADWRLERGDVLERMPGRDRYYYQHFFGDGDLDRELAAAGLRVVEARDDETVVLAARLGSSVAPHVASALAS